MARKKVKRKTNALDRSGPGFPLDEKAAAMIWTLVEEGLSRREIASQLKLGFATVDRHLAKDPVRLEGIRIAQREARSKKWQRVEDLGLVETIGWLEESRKIRTGKRQPKATDAFVPRFISATRHAAETGTKTVELLNGGPTERIVTESTSELTDNPEALIQMAIEFGVVDRLPPMLRDAARRRLPDGG